MATLLRVGSPDNFLSNISSFLISYFLSLNIGACYITGQWGESLVKNGIFVFTCTILTFFCFSSKNLSFSFPFFDQVSNFRDRIRN